MQAERAKQLGSAAPETLEVVVQSIADAMQRCSPFSESTLLVAFAANPEETQRILQKAVKQVLSAPVSADEYAWFMRCVFPSTVWMMRAKNGDFLFQSMMAIAQSMTRKIDDSMDSIFEHLKSHTAWGQVTAIENHSVVARQDDDRVGLLTHKGIREVAVAEAAAKQRDDGDKDMAAFVDNHLALNMLSTTGFASTQSSRAEWAP